MNMKDRAGKYINQKVGGEAYKAYLPNKLISMPPIDLAELYSHLDKATRSLAELNGIAKLIPNISLFIYMYVRKEALLSSQIEGTPSSFSDLILFESDQDFDVSIEDVEEVFNYIKSTNYGLERLRSGFPLSLRLLKEIHGILLKGSRGSQKMPGEFRKSQNWIGGSRPGNAQFVPPPVDYLMESLSDLEKFIHSEDVKLPILVQAALIHVQFETIHPFLDGNGRLGRLLITLFLCEKGMLDEPILYLSLYLKQNRKIYYDLLQEVRDYGRWEVWIEFFLEGIYLTSQQAINSVRIINNIFEEDTRKIESLGRARLICLKVLEYLKQLPQLSVNVLANALEITPPTARGALNNLVKLGIVKEISGKKRDRIYVYKRYLDVLEEGMEPL